MVAQSGRSVDEAFVAKMPVNIMANMLCVDSGLSLWYRETKKPPYAAAKVSKCAEADHTRLTTVVRILLTPNQLLSETTPFESDWSALGASSGALGPIHRPPFARTLCVHQCLRSPPGC